MPLFSVDPAKCNRDGICAATCPMRIIQLPATDGTPRQISDAEKYCINCGHCMAVCPSGALSLTTMPVDQSPPIRPEWVLSVEQAEQLLRGRRSIRTYKDRNIPRADLQRLIEMARFAPSGHNRQPVQWLVLQDPADVRRYSAMVIDFMRDLLVKDPGQANEFNLRRVVDNWENGVDTICRGAPHVILAHAPADERTAPVACTLALGYMELAAPSLGVGTCWAGYLNWAANMWPPMSKALELPPGHAPFGAMMLGYPKYRYHRMPDRNPPPVLWR